jgi:hypothetical protein
MNRIELVKGKKHVVGSSRKKAAIPKVKERKQPVRRQPISHTAWAAKVRNSWAKMERVKRQASKSPEISKPAPKPKLLKKGELKKRKVHY